MEHPVARFQFKDGDNLIGGPVAVVNGTRRASTHVHDGRRTTASLPNTAAVSGVSGSTSAPKVIKVQSARTATSVAVTAPREFGDQRASGLERNNLTDTERVARFQFKDGSNNLRCARSRLPPPRSS